MSTTPPNQPSVSPNRPGTPDAKTDVQPPFEEQIRAIWEKKENRNAVYIGCAVVVLLIIGWYGYKALAAQHEAEIEAAYAAAVTPARLRAFAQENGRHPLAGAAYLKMADDAYTAGNYTEAIGNYSKAAAALPGTPFATRALLGKTMSQIRSGNAPEATAMLRQLAEDTTQLKAVRCEAAYHVASLAFDNGNFSDVVKFTDIVLQLDPAGMQADSGFTWAKRAFILRARAPVPVAAAAVPPPPTEATPAVSLKLPGT
jgi:tetratricopeptide (TPR) repeat protein